MNLPNDPLILLSMVNTKLRDFYPTLNALCDGEEADKQVLAEKLQAAGYTYSPERNQFVRHNAAGPNGCANACPGE